MSSREQVGGVTPALAGGSAPRPPAPQLHICLPGGETTAPPAAFSDLPLELALSPPPPEYLWKKVSAEGSRWGRGNPRAESLGAVPGGWRRGCVWRCPESVMVRKEGRGSGHEPSSPLKTAALSPQLEQEQMTPSLSPRARRELLTPLSSVVLGGGIQTSRFSTTWELTRDARTGPTQTHGITGSGVGGGGGFALCHLPGTLGVVMHTSAVVMAGSLRAGRLDLTLSSAAYSRVSQIQLL